MCEKPEDRGRWKCRIGWHLWERWQKLRQRAVGIYDWYEVRLRTEYYDIMTRACKRCGKIQSTEVGVRP